jgi:hypothetical protein
MMVAAATDGECGHSSGTRINVADQVAPGVDHEKVSRGRVEGEAGWEVELRRRTHAVDGACRAAARERVDNTVPDAADSVAVRDKDNARGVYGDAGRAVETRGGDRTLGKALFVVTRKRRDGASRRDHADAFAAGLGHVEDAARSEGEAARSFELRRGAHAVGPALHSAAGEGGDDIIPDAADSVIVMVRDED